MKFALQYSTPCFSASGFLASRKYLSTIVPQTMFSLESTGEPEYHDHCFGYLDSEIGQEISI